MEDRQVLVVDLREAALRDDREALEHGTAAPAFPADEPIEEDIGTVAILYDESDAPLLLPIAPTRDREELDAIARVIRFAVLRGDTIAKVAIDYGGELERRLAFERRLPAWAYDGIDAPLPPSLRALAQRR